ncbi:MAG TPA: DUF2306 domain-containing protein [Candidatus Binatia bacterium]|nr:DUF2306 domain-containing protein [Candidatus Binatia bacterium]
MTPARAQPKWMSWIGWGLTIGILAAAIVPFGPQIVARVSRVSFDGPDWALWARLSWVIKLHIFAALSALLIGTAILLQRKGSRLHKTLGWGWVLAMAATAVSSLWITELNGNVWSFVHLLSGWTIIALPMAIFAIRGRKVEAHRRAMTGIFVGGLIVAGSLSFIPGRFMFEFFFG